MKKLIIVILLSLFLAMPVFAADLYVAWTVNDPIGVATEQNLYYREDPGPSGDAELLAGTGFVKVPLNLADREFTVTGLLDDTSYCLYLDIVSPNSVFETDVYGATARPARIVKRTTTYVIQVDEVIPVR